MYMYNGTNTTNPTAPPVGGGLTAYDIILIVGAVFSGLATLLGAINCYRQQAKSKETHYSDARIEVKRIGPNGQVQEAICSIHINDDEGYDVTKTEARSKKMGQTIDAKKQNNLIIGEARSDEDKDPIIILATNDTQSDIQRNHTNRQLIDNTLNEFHHTVESVFGHVDKGEITVTGDL